MDILNIIFEERCCDYVKLRLKIIQKNRSESFKIEIKRIKIIQF